MRQFIIEEQYVSMRLDHFLSEHLEISRNQVQTMIKNALVLVNQKPSKSNYKLRNHDQIDVELIEKQELELVAQNIPLDVIYEDDDVAVINKPRGMVVHPAYGNHSNTVVNALLYHYPNLSTAAGAHRPGIVHRIDKDTSGLLVITKNDEAYYALKRQLQDKQMSRKYYALVHGVIEHEYGTIDAPIGRNKVNRKTMCVCEENSKEAITKFKVIERFKQYTLVECSLLTGRTHQIRVHMQYIKHPIVGDPVYGYKKTMKTDGQLLHAFELVFIHPRTHKTMTFNVDMPSIFIEVLASLRKE